MKIRLLPLFASTPRPIQLLAAGVILTLGMSAANGQTSYTSTTAITAWNAARWNNTTDADPYTATYTANQNVSFTAGTYSFAGMGATVNVGNVNVADGVTVNFTAAANTFATSGTVRTITVGTGGLLDFSTQAFSTAAGTGFIKSGPGVLALAGAAYTGGFTLNAGTVILRGVNAAGTGGALTLNGGIVASNSNRDLTGKYSSITFGGDVQFGDTVGLASTSANLTFSNDVTLGAALRTLTLGNGGNIAFGGIISNTAATGLSFAATALGSGRFDITNAANTFSGPITILGGEVRFTADGSLGNSANPIIVDGGRLSTLSGATYSISSGRSITIGDSVGTSISTPGAGVLTYDGVLANISGKTGRWSKQGGGTLQLGGVSTYSGETSINNGIVKIAGGANRLPVGTTLSLGQAASANLGTFDLNGFDQQVAGLVSTAGTNAATGKNTVTSATAATLTLASSDNFSYGDATTQNSGIITGALSLVKTGAGTQTLGGANTYTGTTTISGGTLALAGTGALSGTPSISIAAGATFDVSGLSSTYSLAAGKTLAGNGAVNGPTAIAGAVSPGSSIGTLTFNSASTLTGTLNIEYDGTATGQKADRLVVSGAWNISGGTLNASLLSGGGALSGPAYVIASYGSLTGTFATVTGLPSGYHLVYAYDNGLNTNNIALVADAGGGSAYDSWATTAGLTGLNNAKSADPDGDGLSNLAEFGLNSGPLSGVSSGKTVVKQAVIGGSAALTLTLPVRGAPAFSGASAQTSALTDGIVYVIEGSLDLGAWAEAVAEVTGADATAIQAGLPSPDAGWTYRTFRLAAPISAAGQGFLRARIIDPAP